MNSQFLSILSLAFAAAAAISCSQAEPDDPKGDAGKTVIIGVNIPMTKTHLGEADPAGQYKVCWSAGDAIAVNNIASEALAEEAAGQSSAMFTVTGATAPYSIVYPASICSAASGTSLTVNLPDVQDYTADTFAEESNVLYGYSQDGNGVALNHLTGILKLGLKAKEGALTDRVKRVEVISNSGAAPIAGTFTLDVLTGEITALNGDGMITLNVVSDGKEYITLSSEDYTFFHIAVPAGEYSEGFTVKVYDYSNSLMTGIWNPENQDGDGVLAPGAMKNIRAELAPARRTISTQADLEDFIAAADANTPQYGAFVNPETGAVELANDIVCEGTTDLKRITKAWEGTFDGKGHSIIKPDNIAYRSLFSHINSAGTVKNLTIKGKTDKVTVWNTFKPWGTAYPVMFYSGIAIKNFGTIENCHSEVDITLENLLSGSTACNIYVAGICAFNAGMIKDCTNKGDISVVSNNTGGRHCRIGGISLTSASGMYTADDYGKTEPSTDPVMYTILDQSDGYFLNCTNSGAISVSNSTDYRLTGLQIAGIVANVPAGTTESYTRIENCHNTGNISHVEPVYGTRTGARAVAGIVACVGVHSPVDNSYTYGKNTISGPALADIGFPAKITGCTNTGTITNGCYSNPNIDNGAIATYRRQQSFTGGIVGYAHGLDADDVVEIRNCTNNASMYVGARNVNGHIFGGIAGGAYYANFIDCTARQENVEPYTGISGTASFQAGVYGGIAGAIYTSASMTGCKAFSNIYYCYTKEESDPTSVDEPSGVTRTRYMKACGFFTGLVAKGTTLTLSACGVGGTGDFYRSTVRKAIVLNSESDMSDSSNYAFDYNVLHTNPSIVSETISELSYWDGAVN